MVDFPTPTSPMMAPMRLQMHDRNGVHVDSSDEDGDDDDEDEFEDSEPTEATATGTDVEESMTSEGEMCATPESGGSNDGGLPQTVAEKWVAIKGGVETVHPPALPPPQVMTLDAVPAVPAVPIAGTRS
jgi:hypothetical protein